MASPRKQKNHGCQSEVVDSNLHQFLQTLGGRQETLVFDKGPPLKGRQGAVPLQEHLSERHHMAPQRWTQNKHVCCP